MHAIDERIVHPVKMLRYCFVGDQHKFLNQAIRTATLCRTDRNRMLASIQNDLRLRKIKIQTAPLFPLVAKYACQFPHRADIRQERRVFGTQRRCLMFQKIRHVIIDHARLGIDDRLRELVMNDLSLCVDFHEAGKRQPILSLVKAADPIRKPLWQHRHHAVEQIHTGAALQRLLVQPAILFHIVADVRDMHAKAVIPVGKPFYRYCVIQILCVRSVNRKNIFAAQIQTSRDFFVGDFFPAARLRFRVDTA